MLRRRLPSLGSGRFKYVAAIVILALFLLAQGLSSQNGFDTRMHESHVDQPRYVYHSPFRDDPDLAYERNVSQAMHDLEEMQLALDGKHTTNTLWQILLDPAAQRGEDSLLFEEKNSEWKYAVTSYFLVHVLCALTDALQLAARQQRMGRTVRHYNPRVYTGSRDSVPRIPSQGPPWRLAPLPHPVVFRRLLFGRRCISRKIHQIMPVPPRLRLQNG